MKKTSLVKWDAPHGAVHSLATLDGISDARDVLMCISDRSYHVLLNLVNLDATFRARYAASESEAGFIPVDQDSPYWDLFLEVVENLQVEVLDMSCDVVGVLEDILAQLSNCCAQQSSILSAIASANNNQATETYLEDHPYYDPPSQNFPTPVGLEDHCQRCYSFAYDWAQANIEAHKQAAIIGQGGIGVLMVIFGIIDLPLGILVGIAAIIVAVALEIDGDYYESCLMDSVPDLACAIFASGTSAQAVSAARTVVQALPGLNPRTKTMLADQCCNAVMDDIFGETYPITPGTPTDCSDCEELPGELVLTAQTVPYNVILAGWLVDYEDESEAWGWSADWAGARLEIGFVPEVDVANVRCSAYIGAESPPSTTSIAIWRKTPWTLVVAETGVPVPEYPPGSDAFEYVWEGVNLEAGIEYRLHYSKWSGEVNWINRIILEEYTP
jgi:hypothetical protein